MCLDYDTVMIIGIPKKRRELATFILINHTGFSVSLFLSKQNKEIKEEKEDE